VGTAVVSGCDASPVLQAAKGVLDAMALAIQGLLIFDHGLAVLARRDARGDAPGGQRCTETVTVVAPIGQQFARGRQGIDHEAGALVVVHLPFGQRHDEGPPLTITDGVELGVQAALGAPDTAGNSPFLSSLAAEGGL
jgi:hypothetical protein